MNTVLMMVLMTFMSQSLQAQGNCLDAHAGVGCSDSGCEATVCAIDPFCCQNAWDATCASEAALYCDFGVDPCNSVVNITCGGTENYSLAAGTGSWDNLGPYGTPGNEQVFSFTAPTTGSYNIAISSSSGYVDLFYKSGACSGTGWSYVDDIITSAANTLTFTGGTTYLFLIDDENTTATTGTISVTCPITDPCSSVISLSCGDATNFSLAGGTGSWNNLGGPYSTPGNEQVFSFTAPTTGSYDIAVSSISGYVDLFYKSSACSGTGWSYVDDIYTSGATNTLSLIGGTTYLFLLDDENTSSSSGTISISCPAVVADPCNSVMSITCGGTENYSLAGTGVWDDLGTYGTPGNEQVFSFTAPTTGFYNITVTNNDYFIDLYYKSSACSGTGWSYVDDIYTSGATNTLSLIGGTTYLFLLDDENTTTSSGTITIICPVLCDPPNAICQTTTVELDTDGNGSITTADINNGSTADCGLASMVASPLSFDCSNVGSVPVTLTVTDINGAVSSCTVNVTVNDTQSPWLTTECPANITLCGAQNVSWTEPAAADNCGIVSTVNNANPGDFFGVGEHNVEYTFTDGAGLKASCSFKITINPLPQVEIDPSNVPEWCQGVKVLFAKVTNIAALAEPLSFEWYQGMDFLGDGQELFGDGQPALIQ
ncbi:MAG: HYR domain-containing protein [Lewinellaceae bacterium]|nr:HYR domain-containing protein [Lewinellaceae bacterium]